LIHIIPPICFFDKFIVQQNQDKINLRLVELAIKYFLIPLCNFQSIKIYLIQQAEMEERE